MVSRQVGLLLKNIIACESLVSKPICSLFVGLNVKANEGVHFLY